MAQPARHPATEILDPDEFFIHDTGQTPVPSVDEQRDADGKLLRAARPALGQREPWPSKAGFHAKKDLSPIEWDQIKKIKTELIEARNVDEDYHGFLDACVTCAVAITRVVGAGFPGRGFSLDGLELPDDPEAPEWHDLVVQRALQFWKFGGTVRTIYAAQQIGKSSADPLLTLLVTPSSASSAASSPPSTQT